MEQALARGLFQGVPVDWIGFGLLAWAIGAGMALAYVAHRRSRPREDRRGAQALLESLRLGLPPGMAVFVLDASGRIEFASHGTRALLGLAERIPLQGRALTDLPCWDEAIDSRQSLARALLKADMGKPQRLDLALTTEERASVLRVDLRPHLSANGDPRRLVVSVSMAPALVVTTKNSADPVTDAPTTGAAPRALVESMLRLLPTSRSLDESARIVAAYLGRALPATSGTLFLPRPGSPSLHAARSWGDAAASSLKISEDSCWALRHGEMHWVEDPKADLACEHHPGLKSTCLPLLFRAERVGVLSLVWRDAAPDRGLLEALAPQLAGALSQTQENLALREQAIRDPLTRLLNRHAFDAELPALLSHAQDAGERAALMVIDIDHFKSFNDRYGHDTGDLVLKNVATRVSQSIRASDRAFRFGGEELVVMMPTAGSEEAHACARRIQLALAELALVSRGERLPPVTVSIGIATYPTDSLTAETLFQTADAGVYAAKAAGRNTIVHQAAAARAA